MRAAVFPSERPARGCVVLVSGRTEFIEKYFEVVRELTDRGFAVVTKDWRGQGLSDRPLPDRAKGHVEDFAVFRDDFDRLIEGLVKPRFRGPYILLTHSMGGAPCLQRLADGDRTFVAAVLCAPMTRIYAPTLRRLGVPLLVRGVAAAGLTGATLPAGPDHSETFEGNLFTSDPARHDRFRRLKEADPDAALGEPTFGWLRAALDTEQDLHAPGRLDQLVTPTLIVSGEKDVIVDNESHAELDARSPLITRRIIADALHEIMMERDEVRDAFWAEFDAFIEPALAAEAAPAGA